MRGCRLKLCLVGACACALFLACSSGDDDELLIQSIAIDEGLSSSTVPESSGSAVPESSDGISSSSSELSVDKLSSSVSRFEQYYASGWCRFNFSWSGPEGEYFVNTGCDNYTETSGYWYSFSDSAVGGLSSIIWPVSRGNEYSEDALDPVIDYCGGICGSFKLVQGTYARAPFVGVAFNIAGTEYATGGDPVPIRIEIIEMLCVEYTSDVDIYLELSLGKNVDAELEGDLPFVILPKTVRPSYDCNMLSGFKQGGWGPVKITMEEAVNMLTAIRFKLQAESDMTGNFNIISVSTI